MTGGASVANSTCPSRRETDEEIMVTGSSIGARAQPVAQREIVQKQSGTWIRSGNLSLRTHITTGSARRPFQSDSSSGNESDSSSIMIVDEHIAPPKSRPAPQKETQNGKSALFAS
jgi:hypothetical protein